jgi:hypothetical protein
VEHAGREHCFYARGLFQGQLVDLHLEASSKHAQQLWIKDIYVKILAADPAFGERLTARRLLAYRAEATANAVEKVKGIKISRLSAMTKFKSGLQGVMGGSGSTSPPNKGKSEK